ncbi:hypothetical protein SaccyDRAFT_4954, partial [Saccharomonospora cyanea NA-134]
EVAGRGRRSVRGRRGREAGRGTLRGGVIAYGGVAAHGHVPWWLAGPGIGHGEVPGAHRVGSAGLGVPGGRAVDVRVVTVERGRPEPGRLRSHRLGSTGVATADAGGSRRSRATRALRRPWPRGGRRWFGGARPLVTSGGVRGRCGNGCLARGLRQGVRDDPLVDGVPQAARQHRLLLLSGPPTLSGRTRASVRLRRPTLGGVSGEHLGDADTTLGVERPAPLPLGFLAVALCACSPFLRLRSEAGSAVIVGHARSLRSGSPVGLPYLLVDRREDGFRYRTYISHL